MIYVVLVNTDVSVDIGDEHLFILPSKNRIIQTTQFFCVGS
jgi:hypothetical protein